MTAPPEVIAADDPEWCAGCQQKHSKCECPVTAVDRSDNGQDEGVEPTAAEVLWAGILLDPLDGSDVPWPVYKVTRDGIARALAEASGRAGAGEQQRVSPELSRYLTGLAGYFRDFGRADVADELLALLGGPQPDGEAVAAARACWCAHCEGIVLAADHPTNWVARIGGRRFIVCRDCGDKRCPRAAHHDAPCAYREPCPVYSHGADGWHCAVTGDHDQHTNAAGDETW